MTKNKQNNIPKGYKNTKLGIIPDEWEIKKVEYIFDFISTNSLSRSKLNYEITENSIYNIHYGDIHSTYTKSILDFSEKNKIPVINSNIDFSKFSFLKDGDLIIADVSEDYNGVGEAIELKNVNNKKVVGGLHTFALRDKNNITSKEYRAYILKNQTVSKKLKTIATGSKVYGISKSNLSKFELVIPPLPEQKKIAKILSTWDKAIETTTKLIQAKQNRNSIFAEKLILGKKQGVIYNKTKLGVEIPVNWQTKIVSDLFDERRETSNNTNKYTLFSLTIEKGLTEKTQQYERSFLLKDKENNQFRLVYKNDILYNPMNIRFGAIAISKTDKIVSVSAYYNILKAKTSEIDPLYFISLFKTKRFMHVYERIAIGSLVEKKRVHLSNFLKIEIPFPPLKEQKKIAQTLTTADKEIELLQNYLAKLQEQKKGLMQQLLTGKKRVITD